MPNLNINGRTADPNSIRQINVPQGETPASFVEKNKPLIQKNFKDELYFEHEGNLFVTEDSFVIEHMGTRNPKDAKLRVGAVPAVALFIDNEDDTHKVTALKFEGASPATQKWLDDELKVKSGRQVNLHDIQKEANRLFESERFLSLDIVPRASEKGIELTLQVQEVPKEVAFQGLSPEAAKEAASFFPQPLTQKNITAGMTALQKELDGNPSSLLRGLDFQIQGKKLQVIASLVQVPSSMNFMGATESEAKNMESFFQQPLNYDNIQGGMEKLRKHFNSQGFILPTLDFQVMGDEVFVKMSKAPTPTKVDFQGMSVYSAAEVQALFKFPLNMESIQEGLVALQDKYTEDGYLLLGEGVSADLSKGVLTVQVHEAKLGDIEITGNDKTKKEVIMREMRNKKDQPVNMKTLNQDLRRVSGTGLFSGVQRNIKVDESNPDRVKIQVHTSEDKASSLNVGAGYSMSNGPFGSASLSLGNVGGENRKVSIDGTLGTKVWGGGVSFYDPWMFEDRTSFGASVYHRQWQGPYSDEIRTGAKATIGKPLGDIYESPWRADLTLGAERIGIDDQYSVSGDGIDYRVGLRGSVSYNTLDDPIMPNDGTRAKMGFEPVWVSGETLLKTDAKIEHHIPLSERFTFSASAQGGAVFGDAPLYEKYNNSGLGRTLMGWDSDGSLVGSNYAMASAGVNAKIWGPVSATAKLTGGDFFDGVDIKPKLGAGVGINVRIGNLGILNAGYGFKLMGQEKDEEKGAFHIGFGIPF